MSCKRFHYHGAEELERGRRDLEHLIACPRCRRFDESYRAVGETLSELADDTRPAGTWQAKVWARIARQPERSARRRQRTRVLFASVYAALLLLVGLFSASAYAADLEARSDAEATMERAAHAVDTSIARVEVDEAEADLRFQIVHVAYAQARAASPDADQDDLALAEARTRALQQLSERHHEALTSLATLN